jgi:hypothetical protein
MYQCTGCVLLESKLATFARENWGNLGTSSKVFCRVSSSLLLFWVFSDELSIIRNRVAEAQSMPIRCSKSPEPKIRRVTFVS